MLASPPIDLQVELTRIDPNGNPASVTPMLESAIEHLVYDVLEANYGGWAINDGSYGEFKFDAANQTIAVEFNKRFMDIRCHDSVL